MLIQKPRIELFGGLRLVLVDRVVERFTTQKVALLLAYLALYPDRQHTREDLCQWLWPEDLKEDYEEYGKRTRQSLRQALTHLRRYLEPPGVPGNTLLRTTNTYVQLVSDLITSDVTEFRAALKMALRKPLVEREPDLRRAVSLYQGDLLYGYDDVKIDVERDRFKSEYFNTVTQLASIWEQVGAPADALELSTRAGAQDPSDEEACVVQMRVYAALGRNDLALAHYARLEAALSIGFNARPDAKLQEWADKLRLLTKTSPPALSTPTIRLDSPSSHSASDIAPGQRDWVKFTAALPMPLTPCFGRSRELSHIVHLLARSAPSAQASRLVTVTGLGGTGKTRVALEAGNALRAVYGDAIWFVSLAELEDAFMISNRVLQAMRIPTPASEDPTPYLISLLQQQPALLILDNMEQLLGESTQGPDGAGFVQQLLESVSELSLLVTSRNPLRLDGERIVSLKPLPLPDLELGLEDLSASPGIQLFVYRAQECRSDFILTPRNAEDVAGLVRYLEGLPLAIVLAASQITMFTPAEMLAELSRRRFQFLTTRRRGVFPRHRSLHAALDWSYSLLSSEARSLFGSLACFRGDWTRPAVEYLWAEEGHTNDTIELVLAQYEECGLIQTTRIEELVWISEADPLERREQTQFTMLETVRAYARELLTEEHWEKYRCIHANYFVWLTEQCSAHFPQEDAAQWYDYLAQNFDNVRAALDWLQVSNLEKALYLASLLWMFWYVRGPITEGRHYFRTLLEHAEGLTPLLLTKAYGSAGSLAFAQTDVKTARVYHEAALAAARESRNVLSVVDALADLGLVDQAEEKGAEACAHFEEALNLLETTTPLTSPEILNRKSYILNLLGSVAYERQEYELARTYKQQALQMMTQLGNEHNMSYCLETLGLVEHAVQKWDEAQEYYRASLALARKLGHETRIGSTLANLGRLHLDLNEIPAAQAYSEEALNYTRNVGERFSLASILQILGKIHLIRRDLQAAQANLSEALPLWQSLNEDSLVEECKSLLQQCQTSAYS